MANVARGFPTKEFFVGMLTRDIALSDAILDLLDNCLDGVVRQSKKSRDDPHYYEGFYSHIHITPDSFSIEDNCGGIPRDVAEKYAFRMGRSAEKEEANLPTVGIYGIGMKRAIFKIGKQAEVTTRHNGEAYKVCISEDWSTDEDNWDFPIEDIQLSEQDTALLSGGTRICVSKLNSGITEEWSNQGSALDRFIDKFIKSVQQSYSFILQKGFQIEVNGTPVEAEPFKLLVSTENNGVSIKPYMYKTQINDVKVSLAVGFYAPPPSPDEIDEGTELKRSSEDAGWTVLCNDRVVLYNDKSHLTGWGESGVPQYHTQFIGIRGIVVFESNNPKSLPMTTTKRGVDTSSAVYAMVKNKMREGLKLFTNYTNQWKGRNSDERKYSTSADSIPMDVITRPKEEVEAETNSEFTRNKDAWVLKPKLPSPPNDKPYRRICYNKSLDDINILIEYLYHDSSLDVKPSVVGEKCFDMILEEAKR